VNLLNWPVSTVSRWVPHLCLQ